MRKVVADLVNPVLERAMEDRQKLLILDKATAKVLSRVDALETAVFKEKSATLLDEISDMLRDTQTAVQKQIQVAQVENMKKIG